MHDKPDPTRVNAPAPHGGVLPLPTATTPARWARRGVLWLAVVAGFFVLLRCDVVMMAWRDLRIGRPSGLFRQLLFGFRDFGQALPIAVALIIVATYDSRRGWIIATVLLAQVLQFTACQPLKLTVARYRPSDAVKAVGELASLTPGQTWIGWRQGNGEIGRQSFPSGHSAGAFAFAGVLAWFYRRLAWLLWVLAVGCAASRYLDGVHWPSDCLAGAAIGYTTAWLALRPYVWALPVNWYRRGVQRRRARVHRCDVPA